MRGTEDLRPEKSRSIPHKAVQRTRGAQPSSAKTGPQTGPRRREQGLALGRRCSRDKTQESKTQGLGSQYPRPPKDPARP
eukprot:7349729-Prymnesium_polylepis.1